MPQVVVGAAIGAGISTALATTAAISASTFTLGSFITAGTTASFFASQFVISAALGAASSLLQDKPQAGLDTSAAGRTTWVKQPIANRDVVYGRNRKSGVLVYAETTNSNEYLHLVFTLAAHEIQEIESIYVNDEIVTLDGSGNVTAPSKYSGLIRVKKHLGATDQAADADLVSESNGKWSNNHRLRGVAYLYVRLKFDQEAFGGGIPGVSAIVKGKKLFDPRSSTTAYSNNAALVLRDYLSNSDYGVGASAAEIDDTSFIAAANICDEDVTLSAGGTENRYEANGVLNTGATPKSNIEGLLGSCGGTLSYSNGKWQLNVAAYKTPSITLTDDDLRGAISIATKHSRRDNFNGVKGVFISPDANWQPTDYPSYSSATFKAEDNDIESFVDLQLQYTTSTSMAQRLAKIVLYKQRQQLTVNVRTSLKPFDVSIGDTIKLTNERYGWNEKVFEVMNWSFDPNPGSMTIGLSLREISSDVFNWSVTDEKIFEQDNTTLSDPFALLAPGVAISDELRNFNQDIVTFLIADVTSSNKLATEFEVQAKKTSDSTYINLGRASGGRFELPKVDENVSYDVRARAINVLGGKSAWTTGSKVVVGKAAPPSDVSNFKVNIVGDVAHLSWDAVTDLDLSHYKIRHASSTSGATYSGATDLASKVSRPATSVVVPAKTGTYFIKAIDKTGNSSLNADSSVAIVNKVNSANIVQTLTESTTYTGTKTNCSVDSGSLTIDSGYSSATYEFANSLDLGAKYQTRFTSNIVFTRYDRSNLFDSAGGLFDARSGLFDGGASVDFDDVDVTFQIRTTDDDPSGTPTWSAWRDFVVGEYAARAFEFRLQLEADDTTVSPQITTLAVTADMPDRTVAESDITSGASSYAVTFSPAFKALQGVGISAANLASGDYYEITSKSASGFTITFKNSGGSAVSRDFDYVARGYGEVIT